LSQPRVGIIMGSRSDRETMLEAARVLDELGVAYQQGFLHSRPVLAEALPALWSSEPLRG